jgi:hypothetical protein
MTKIPINYSNTIIYKIVCNDLLITDVYIGSTTNFVKRKYLHKSDCNNMKGKSFNLKIYVIIRANGGWNSWSMIEIEKYPCNDNNEARARERYWFELTNANMNSQKPLITKEERMDYFKQCSKNKYELNKKEINENHKKYYDLNKTVLCEKKKEYRELNKTVLCEKKKEYRELNKAVLNEKFKCFCGGCYTNIHKQTHIKTKKHQCYLAQIKENHLENEK